LYKIFNIAYYFLGDDFMNTKIPFTKDITFEKKVSEITSISLEHEIKVLDGVLKGNFIVSGDYKSHEVSVNKEPFSYMLPFEIELSQDIDTETIEFMIDDFTYEIIDNTDLRVNIDFNILASKKEIVEEPESIFEDASELFSDNDEERETINQENVNNLEDILNEEVVETKDEVLPQEVEDNLRDQVAVQSTIKEVSEDTIINSIKNTDDEYTTYHIHMVSDGETVETICTMYNSNLNILGEYNELGELNAGDKVIIPEKNE
jgi:hypothetical protein